MVLSVIGLPKSKQLIEEIIITCRNTSCLWPSLSSSYVLSGEVTMVNQTGGGNSGGRQEAVKGSDQVTDKRFETGCFFFLPVSATETTTTGLVTKCFTVTNDLMFLIHMHNLHNRY
jgi:hypothetical protein